MEYLLYGTNEGEPQYMESVLCDGVKDLKTIKSLLSQAKSMGYTNLRIAVYQEPKNSGEILKAFVKSIKRRSHGKASF